MAPFTTRCPRTARIRQHDVTDCAAACLASVAAYHGYRLPIARIRQLASTERTGTSVLGVVEAATRMGFAAKGVRGGPDSLAAIPVPAIAHVVLGNGLHHFVVLYGVGKRRITVMDPATGRLCRLSHAEFRAQWTGVLVLLVPAPEFRPGNEVRHPLERFWSLLRPHRSVLLQALVGALGYTLLGLSTAIYVQKLVDHVLADGNARLLNLLGVLMVALLAVQSYLGMVRSLLTVRTGQKIDAALILGYYRHLLRLPQRFFDTMRVGEVLSRVSDAVKIRALVNDLGLDVAINVLTVALSIVLMFGYSWRLALLTMAALPLQAVILLLANRANRKVQRGIMESAAELESQLVESLGATATLKRLGLEEHAGLRMETRFVRLLGWADRSARTGVFTAFGSQFVSQLLTIALLWSGGALVLDQSITPGELMSAYALLGYLTGPVVSLVEMNRTVQDALIAADRLYEIMDLEREETGPGVELTRDRIGDLVLRNVRFRYGARAPTLDGLDLVIPRGSYTAVVGESGSGKSTLAALLQGLYAVEAGEVRIGGHDVRHLDRGSLRSLVGAVPQQVDLFAGSVVDNVAVGDPEPDMRRVLAVCELLGVTEFVQRLPAGFGTELGERGASLSGGQRQRLAIARALYRDPEVLILDEATSALDPASERHVQRAIEGLRARGKTVVVISHRLSTVARADRIVVLEQGRVAEEGTHLALMARTGAYHRLWSGQQLEPGGEALPRSRPPSLRGAVAAGWRGGTPEWLRRI